MSQPTIKKALQPTHAFLTAQDKDTTVEELLNSTKFMKLLEAGKGGFNGENSFVEHDGVKVARICAMTQLVYPHSNDNKDYSYFYKNGSYMIGAEVIKANKRKEWEDTKTERLQELEDKMMGGAITPQEWKEKNNLIQEEEFDFTLDDEDRQRLADTFGGFATKEDYVHGELPLFTDFAEEVKALRDEYVKPTEEEEDEEVE